MLKLAAIAFFLSLPAIAETGRASWYGGGERLGRHTENGERFRPDGLTCAHRTAKFGTRFKVTDLMTGRSVICRVTDRGPFIRGRVLDLSRGAAQALGIIRRGTASVRIERVW